jgi:hypothetical protein
MSKLKGLRTALVTGASAGIGLEIARELASRGLDLVLVARRRERLEELASELSSAHGVTTHVLTADLSDPAAPDALVAQVDALGLQVDVLVNNAGIGQSGPMADADPGRLIAMIQINVTALTALTRAFTPGMIARGRGALLNVGSTAGFQPGPNMAVYYATKAYVYSLTDALVAELRPHGVTVTNLSPGATSTEFQAAADIENSWLFAAGVDSAQAVARAGVDGLDRGKSLVVPGLKNKATAVSARFTPRPVIRKVVAKINSDRD